MTKIYACLVGNWVCLNDDPNCKIGEHMQSPDMWWEEGAPVYAPTEGDSRQKDSFYGLNYVNLHYNGVDYRINPMFIQVVTE